LICYCTIGRAVDGKGETSGGESWCLESLKNYSRKKQDEEPAQRP